MLVAPREMLLRSPLCSVLSAACANWAAELALSATPMAEASMRGELDGVFSSVRDIDVSLPQGCKAAEYRVNKSFYQLRFITIRTEFTFFTLFAYGFYELVRLPRFTGRIRINTIGASLPSGTAPCCCTFPACSLARRCCAFAKPWKTLSGPTVKSPPGTNPPKPNTTCNCLKGTLWPRKSARRCWSACGKPRCLCQRRYRTRSSHLCSIATQRA